MYEAQDFVDLRENSNFGDPNSWLSAEDNSSPTQLRTHSSITNAITDPGTKGNLDRDLFKDLVEIVPLVQSLIVFSFGFAFSVLKRCILVSGKWKERKQKGNILYLLKG
ncbi:movement protein binding protein 2C [Quillaja saponaria]|uniref:Movement protein binding protein 2C n=1 Tax=Quillaja saponaria TaxID=32244 RepID=A0AAD7KLW2_QUISA|nr:movement protein binding protein 2C [Quillaja saponaria]